MCLVHGDEPEVHIGGESAKEETVSLVGGPSYRAEGSGGGRVGRFGVGQES